MLYRFDNTWHLKAPPDQVYAALADVDGYGRWWPQIREIHRIDAVSGKVRIRSLLPYTLDLVLARDVQDEARRILRVNVDGDLQGWCAWHLATEGAGTQAHFTQEVNLTPKPLTHLPPILRPLLRANHTHMMRSGNRGLNTHLTQPSPHP